MHAIHTTPAALFRAVADPANRPTILFDEIDTIFGPRARDNEELRGFLNAGHRRSGVTYRCESSGHQHRVVAFPSFAAVALAGLHDLPDTIATRSVIVRMRRRAPRERVEPYRMRIHEPEGLAIGERLSLAMEGREIPTEPELPTGVSDRPADVWEPLLAVAQVAGAHWPVRARAACLHYVSGNGEAHEPSLNLLLLGDCRRVFAAAGDPDHLPTATLVGALQAIEESPWRDLRGKAIDPSFLARRLRGYEVRSVNMRVGATVVKGYRRDDLSDAWTRYLPDGPLGGRAQDGAASPPIAATPATPLHGTHTHAHG
jgi:hypothetical protein